MCLPHRHILAAVHFNFNLQRECRKKADDTEQIKITYPKFKNGEAVVRNVRVSQNFGESGYCNRSDSYHIPVLVMLISPLNIGSNNIIDSIFFFGHFPLQCRLCGRNFSNIYDSHQGGIERGCRQAEGHDTFSYEHNAGEGISIKCSQEKN